MGVSKNRGTPKSSILIGFSIINHPFWGTPIFGNTHIGKCTILTWILYGSHWFPVTHPKALDLPKALLRFDPSKRQHPARLLRFDQPWGELGGWMNPNRPWVTRVAG